MRKVAVYGTLRFGQSNHSYFLKNKKPLITEKTKEKFDMYNIGYFPAIIENGNTNITIEVYEVNDREWNDICFLEGYNEINEKNSLYNYKEIETSLGKANIFVFNDTKENLSNKNLIKSGDWLDK